MLIQSIQYVGMQARQEHFKDWHQQLIAALFKSPLVKTRVGFAFTSIGHLIKFDLKEFPATKAKKLFFEQVKRELYCFLKGQTSAKDLHAAGVTIWDADLKKANKDSIGPIYGYQWRKWPLYGNYMPFGFNQHGNTFDQLRWAIDELKRTHGQSRRAIVSAWNAPQVLSSAALLPPCHVLFQFNIINDTLYTDVFQRSADVFLGLPFDVASFAILSNLVANELNIENEKLNYHISNLHLYKEHTDAAKQELMNEPSDCKPFLLCNDTVDTFHYSQCELKNYTENRIIKAKLLV